MSDQLVEKQLKDVKAGEWIYHRNSYAGDFIRLCVGYCSWLNKEKELFTDLDKDYPVRVIQNNTEGFDWKPTPKWVEATSDTPAWTECRHRDEDNEEWQFGKFLLVDPDPRMSQYNYLVCYDTCKDTGWYRYCEVQEKSS